MASSAKPRWEEAVADVGQSLNMKWCNNQIHTCRRGKGKARIIHRRLTYPPSHARLHPPHRGCPFGVYSKGSGKGTGEGRHRGPSCSWDPPVLLLRLLPFLLRTSGASWHGLGSSSNFSTTTVFPPFPFLSRTLFASFFYGRCLGQARAAVSLARPSRVHRGSRTASGIRQT